MIFIKFAPIFPHDLCHNMTTNKIAAYNSALELIGNTPLVKLNRITDGLKGDFYAKVEAFNPGHSNKDRIALTL
jgi:hypothetical protein